jgi:hypothetical protein
LDEDGFPPALVRASSFFGKAVKGESTEERKAELRRHEHNEFFNRLIKRGAAHEQP